MLERCITGLMDEFEGEQDYYFAKRQYEEFLLPALQGVGRGFATGLYVGHQACVVSRRERWQRGCGPFCLLHRGLLCCAACVAAWSCARAAGRCRTCCS